MEKLCFRRAGRLPLVTCLALLAVLTPAVHAVAASAAPLPRPAAPTTAAAALPAPPAVLDAATIDHVFPADAVVNVKTQFGAKGDGVTDDTQAIRNAIRAGIGSNSHPKVLYFPNGTYLVSDTLDWHNAGGYWDTFLTFQGESRNGTVIRLVDHAAGFADPTAPRAVILTAAQGGNADGGGNQGQNNFLLDLTVNTGAGNPGAIGIDYIANNRCAIRDVAINSGDGAGVAGLSMTRYATGPCLFQDIAIDGFSYGVTVTNLEYSMTFNRLNLSDQQVVGMQVNDNVVTVEGLTSANTVPAVRIGSRYNKPIALVTIINGTLLGGSPAWSAITNGGNLYARNVIAPGYQSVVNGVPGTILAEYVSSPAPGSGPTSLNLPIQATPIFSDYNLADWVSVTSFGAKSNSGDATGGIQAAIDSGAPVVYFPIGSYRITRPIHLRGTTRALIGLESSVIGQGTAFNDPTAPIISVESSPGAPVYIHGFLLFGPAANTGIVDASSATVVLEDLRFPSVAYHSTPGAGPLFIEDVDGGAWSFDYPQQIWARQLNSEPTTVKVINNGARLWMLGFKTEQASTALLTLGGGQTELLGGLIYPVNAVNPAIPAIISVDSSMSAVYATSSYTSANNYAIQIQTTHLGVTQTVRATALVPRSYGSVTSLYADPLNAATGSALARPTAAARTAGS